LQAKYKALEEERARLVNRKTAPLPEAEKQPKENVAQKSPHELGYKPLSQLDAQPSEADSQKTPLLIDDDVPDFHTAHPNQTTDRSLEKTKEKPSLKNTRDHDYTRVIRVIRSMEKQNKRILKLESKIDSLEKQIRGEGEPDLSNKSFIDAQPTPHSSPRDVVAAFDRYYGGPDMDKIKNLTTEKFRDFKPETVWIMETWQALNDLSYQRTNSEIKELKMDKNRAAVLVETRIKTTYGETSQQEIFYLVRDAVWLIDRLDVPKRRVDFKNIHP
jgi:hypothetical protein